MIAARGDRVSFNRSIAVVVWPCSNGWPHTYVCIDTTNWTPWVITKTEKKVVRQAQAESE